jgi:hypothetical protein
LVGRVPPPQPNNSLRLLHTPSTTLLHAADYTHEKVVSDLTGLAMFHAGTDLEIAAQAEKGLGGHTTLPAAAAPALGSSNCGSGQPARRRDETAPWPPLPPRRAGGGILSVPHGSVPATISHSQPPQGREAQFKIDLCLVQLKEKPTLFLT